MLPTSPIVPIAVPDVLICPVTEPRMSVIGVLSPLNPWMYPAGTGIASGGGEGVGPCPVTVPLDPLDPVMSPLRSGVPVAVPLLDEDPVTDPVTVVSGLPVTDPEVLLLPAA
jgi:hypothetical protein